MDAPSPNLQGYITEMRSKLEIRAQAYQAALADNLYASTYSRLRALEKQVRADMRVYESELMRWERDLARSELLYLKVYHTNYAPGKTQQDLVADSHRAYAVWSADCDSFRHRGEILEDFDRLAANCSDEIRHITRWIEQGYTTRDEPSRF
jgi:hypothetical protein